VKCDFVSSWRLMTFLSRDRCDSSEVNS